MSKLQWDKTGERLYELGLDRGVFFPMGENSKYAAGVAWNGLTAVNERPSGAESNAIWADNIKYANIISAEDFNATIEAFTYPDEFEACDGAAEIAPGVVIGQQNRKPFGLSYRTLIGNDTEGQEHGYKIHLVYGAQAAPSERNRQTINENPEPGSMSWELSTTPINVPGFKPTAHLTIDSTKTDAAKLAALEEILYGKDGEDGASTDPHLPLPEELAELMKAAG